LPEGAKHSAKQTENRETEQGIEEHNKIQELEEALKKNGVKDDEIQKLKPAQRTQSRHRLFGSKVPARL